MHVKVGDKWEQKYTRDADPEAPAGGASSNVLDMANWLILQLASGAWQGRPLIDETALTDTQLPHARTGLPSSVSARSGFYGFGMNVGYDYAGRTHFNHSGGFDQGAATVINLLPSANVGIVVLTNGMPLGIPEAVANYFYDYVEAGSEQADWLTLYGQRFAAMRVNPASWRARSRPSRSSRPSRTPTTPGRTTTTTTARSRSWPKDRRCTC